MKKNQKQLHVVLNVANQGIQLNISIARIAVEKVGGYGYEEQ